MEMEFFISSRLKPFSFQFACRWFLLSLGVLPMISMQPSGIFIAWGSMPLDRDRFEQRYMHEKWLVVRGRYKNPGPLRVSDGLK